MFHGRVYIEVVDAHRWMSGGHKLHRVRRALRGTRERAIVCAPQR